MDLGNTSDAIGSLVRNVERVITGKRRAVELACTALFGSQHLLIEDVPGVGKTMLARAIAKSMGGHFKRVQGTSDLLPTDITGAVVFDQRSSAFTFSPGPIFANVVLFDEVNRATPKTQSALLEVMEEGSVSADGALHPVPQPFFVVATRNPTEHHGTFPLPEGELDRFGMSVGVGYPDLDAERRVVTGQMDDHPITALEPVLDPDDVIAHREAVRTVHVDEGILDYLVRIVRESREHPDVALGASPRASLSLTRSAQAYALLRGRDFVTPDDIKALAPAVLTHRILVASDRPSRRGHETAIVDEILHRLPAPVGYDAPAGSERAG